MQKRLLMKKLSTILDNAIELREEIQVLRDELDSDYEKESKPEILKQLTAVQCCFDLLKEVEKELYNA